MVECFSPLLECFTTKHGTVRASLFVICYTLYERPKSGKWNTREEGHELTMLYFFDSKIAVGDLPFGKEGNDTIFTYFGLRK